MNEPSQQKNGRSTASPRVGFGSLLRWLLIQHLPLLATLFFIVAGFFPHSLATEPDATEPSPSKSNLSVDWSNISLVNDVIPVLTKSGCNAGTCHAKAGNGQNGFQLSLLEIGRAHV